MRRRPHGTRLAGRMDTARLLSRLIWEPGRQVTGTAASMVASDLRPALGKMSNLEDRLLNLSLSCCRCCCDCSARSNAAATDPMTSTLRGRESTRPKRGTPDDLAPNTAPPWDCCCFLAPSLNTSQAFAVTSLSPCFLAPRPHGTGWALSRSDSRGMSPRCREVSLDCESEWITSTQSQVSSAMSGNLEPTCWPETTSAAKSVSVLPAMDEAVFLPVGVLSLERHGCTDEGDAPVCA